MNDNTLVQSMVDSLETGLPERPDLASVRAAARRQRRRRHLGWTAGACAAAGALVVPALLLAGPGGPADTADHDVASDPSSVAPTPTPTATPTSAPVAVAPGELAGPEFGTGMRAAVEQALPGATFRSEELADGWYFSDQVDAWMTSVSNPVSWETLFSWSQTFGLPDGGRLNVAASRTTSSYLGDVGATECNQAHYPARRSCEATDVGGQRVLVNDGIRYDIPTRWFRDVDVIYFDETRGMAAKVTVSAYTNAPTWEQARNQLPSAGDLTALGLQEALVLPAPGHYPEPADFEEHMTSAP